MIHINTQRVKRLTLLSLFILCSCNKQEDLYRSAVSCDKSYPMTLSALNDRYEKCEPIYQKVVELDPNSEFGNLAKDQIKDFEIAKHVNDSSYLGSDQYKSHSIISKFISEQSAIKREADLRIYQETQQRRAETESKFKEIEQERRQEETADTLRRIESSQNETLQKLEDTERKLRDINTR